MATITLSELAPAEALHFTFGTAEFDLGGDSASYETDVESVILNALSHPWLRVELPEPVQVVGKMHDQLRPEDDAFSSLGRLVNPNDPDAIAAEQARRMEDEGGAVVPVAIDVGLDQHEPAVTGGVAETFAAIPDAPTTTEDSA